MKKTNLSTLTTLALITICLSTAAVFADSRDRDRGCSRPNDKDCDGYEARPSGPTRPFEPTLHYDFDDNDPSVGSCAQVCG